MPQISTLTTVNQVLYELGRSAISNVNDSNDAKLIAGKIDLLLPLMLTYENWNFAIKYRSDSTPLVDVLSPDYQYTYYLPSDYGRMFSWGNFDNHFESDKSNPFLIANGTISTNDNPAIYYYIVNNVDISVISTEFWRALILFTAFDVAPTLTENENTASRIGRKYEMALKNAISRNNMEKFVVSRPYNSFRRKQNI